MEKKNIAILPVVPDGSPTCVCVWTFHTAQNPQEEEKN